MSNLSHSDRQWVIMQVLILTAIALALVFLEPPEERLLPAWVGIALCAIALVLVAASFVAHVLVNRTIQINVYPSPDRQKRLVVRGIYAYVRHPMYLSAVVLIFGAGIWHGNVVTIAGGLVATLFVYLKAIYEEQLLLQVYSDYPSYMMRTGRLLPRLWQGPNKKT